MANGPAGAAWLGWFSLVPLFLIIRLWHPVRAMLAGALWGLSLYLSLGLTEASASDRLLGFLLLAAVPSLYACLGAWLTRWIGFNPFVLGVAWMGVELALGPVGVRLGLVAATQGEGTFLHWIGSALGYVLVAFVVAVVNASLVSVLSAARLAIPQLPSRISLPNCGTSTPPHRSLFIPLFFIRPSQPRAPPIRC
jgi:apolipoprotein N-acyltransferase